jgi:hypothetical protein
MVKRQLSMTLGKDAGVVFTAPADRLLRFILAGGLSVNGTLRQCRKTPYSVDPMHEIEEAAQSEVPFDSLGMSLVHVARHPDSRTVELTTLLKSTHLRWQATDDGRSAADITIAAVSLSKQRGILASRLRRLTIFSNSQDPARLSASNTLVTITVPVPRSTESVRVVILAQDGGQVGALELEHKVLASAPGSPTPEPQLQQRPGVTSQQRPSANTADGARQRVGVMYARKGAAGPSHMSALSAMCLANR